MTVFQANILPGQGFGELEIWEIQGGLSSTGRPTGGSWKATGWKLTGIVTTANQKEIDQWKQNGHPISHKVTSHGAMEKAKATDYLIMEDGRQFYVQGIKNPGNLNVTMIYYVEERKDIRIGGGSHG